MDRYRELHPATKKKTKEKTMFEFFPKTNTEKKKTRARKVMSKVPTKVPTKMPTKEKTKVKTVVPLTPQQQALEDASAGLEFAKEHVRLAQMEVDLAKTKEVHQFAIPPAPPGATSEEEIDLTQMEGESDEDLTQMEGGVRRICGRQPGAGPGRRL
jgi:hypothetical protein